MVTKTRSNEEIKHIHLRSCNVLMVNPSSLTEVQKEILSFLQINRAFRFPHHSFENLDVHQGILVGFHSL